MRGVSAFPPGFGCDEYIMFVGTGDESTTMASAASDSGPEMVAPSLVADPVSLPDASPADAHDAPGGPPIHYAPQIWAQPAPPRQRVRLGRRGFYLSPSRGDDLDGVEAVAERRSVSIMIPTAVVGILLALAGYFFDFLR